MNDKETCSCCQVKKIRAHAADELCEECAGHGLTTCAVEQTKCKQPKHCACYGD